MTLPSQVHLSAAATAVLAVDFVVLYGVLTQSDEFLTLLTPRAGGRRVPGAPAAMGPTRATE